MATRYFLTVERQTTSGLNTYRHIELVAEYEEGDRTPKQERRHFRALCKRQNPSVLADPTAQITSERA